MKFQSPSSLLPILFSTLFAGAVSLPVQQTVSTPPALTPPAGSELIFTAHATGTQNYVCLPGTGTSTEPSWVFLGPQATLFVAPRDDDGRGDDGFQASRQGSHASRQVATHFLSTVPNVPAQAVPSCRVAANGTQLDCPTWQSSVDSSAVWGSAIGTVTAGTEASCPNQGAIPCLLLKAVANRPGTFGDGILANASYIGRLNTQGGAAPAGACTVGDVDLVPYSADYSFYRHHSEDAR